MAASEEEEERTARSAATAAESCALIGAGIVGGVLAKAGAA